MTAITAKEYREGASKQKSSFQALGRLRSGQMNKLEQKYASHLEGLKIAGEILWFVFSPFNIRLGEKCYYAPDFGVLRKDGQFECHEVKGMWQDDALIKIKVAAERLPFRFVAIQWIKGEWNI